MPVILRGVFWSLVYAIAVIAPLVVAVLGEPPPSRGFLVDFSVALGFVGLAIMALQFALVARFQHVAAPFGMDALLQFHRQIGFVSLAFVLAHPALLVVADPRTLRLFDITSAPLRARFAVTSTVLLLGLVATSVWRGRLRIRYETWQLIHGVLAVLVVACALAHIGLVGRYLARPWQRGLWLAFSATLVGLLGWVRVVKPLLRYRFPWRVARVTPERGGAFTVELTPEGHEGIRFEAGQFAWLMIDTSPFALMQHPFSISSSSERPEELAFTIKARGDFTNTIASVPPGTRAWLDGPYGLFTIDRHEGPGFVFIGGGVGITPLVSMLRTLADREDPRPCTLFYGSKDWESVTFREELEALAKRMRLSVVHVLEKPPEGWEGERGFVNAKVLERHLPPRRDRLQYFICGPSPMMDAMEEALVRLRVPDERIQTERFEMV